MYAYVALYDGADKGYGNVAMGYGSHIRSFHQF
jgi:hypothetical protein